MLSSFQGKYAEAEPLYERSQSIRVKVLGPDHPSVAPVLHSWANLLENQVRLGWFKKVFRDLGDFFITLCALKCCQMLLCALS